MAKAAEIPIDPFEPFAAAGARITRVRADELFEHAVGVLDTEDIERVHDMRVASRRLRAVLEIFSSCFPADEYGAVLDEVKALADALGERRDPDVHIEAMQRFAGAVSDAQKPGIERLVERQRGAQEQGNVHLSAALGRIRDADLRERLHALADAAEDQAA